MVVVSVAVVVVPVAVALVVVAVVIDVVVVLVGQVPHRIGQFAESSTAISESPLHSSGRLYLQSSGSCSPKQYLTIHGTLQADGQ